MFNIYLKSNNLLNQDICFLEERSYDLELDDETSVIFDICDVFEEREIKFIVSGFGQDKWPVSCRFDLPGIIEVIPEIVNKIKLKEYNFKLDFYEQGIEREIIFNEVGNSVRLECFSRTKWSPVPSTIDMDKNELYRIFVTLYEDFISYSNIFCSNLINKALLANWIKLLENE